MAKVALLIGVGEYGNGLSPLPAAPKDVEAMRGVLENPEIGGFDQVTPLINPERQAMEEAIFTLFANRKKDDLLLLFFSGHGVKDDSGNLYLAAHNTRKEQEALVQPTAVAASYIQNIMSNSRSKRQVVILDCCFSGAFAEGMKAKADDSVPVKQQLGGEGRAVLTSSTSTQYSFEHEGFDLSIYTHFLVEGIRTGIADKDQDGAVSVDELHEYASEKVQEIAPGKMKPKIYVVEEGFKILLAKVRVDDPKLKYRQETERLIRNGNISFIVRNLLNLKRDSLGLLSEEAVVIETEVLKPYREYEAKLQLYEQVLTKAIQQEHILSDATLKELQDFEKALGLKNEDVKLIKAKFILPEQTISSSIEESIVQQKQSDKDNKKTLHDQRYIDSLITPKKSQLPLGCQFKFVVLGIILLNITIGISYIINKPNLRPSLKIPEILVEKPECVEHKEKSEEYYQAGKTYFKKKSYNQAIEYLNKAICYADQYEWDSYYYRGQAYYELKNYKAALEDYNIAIARAKNEPWNAESYEGRGDLYSQLGDKQRAIDDYKTAVKLYLKQKSDNPQAEIVIKKYNRLLNPKD
ncbi:caspase, EACC1-associated type [Nostoc favosum]|uniref:Caspase family protein n=1 Tax=Nostoc favosum CHAB5714 TaxID=2780399 RepID=A0ABS8IGM7_9NOSO|nr:caspase family protein [Nostoc favosum]MCC5602986.1 caspase family protein [Nostoc favosum CHAB5714]